MFDLDNWQEIWSTITQNKFRSILTGFGVFWGIFMLVGLIAVSNGFRGGVNKLADGLAENSSFFFATTTSKPYKGFKKGRSWNFINSDIKLLQDKAHTVEHVSPVLFEPPTPNNIVRERRAGAFSIKGIYPSQFLVEKQRLMYGRLINDADVKYKRKVCVIGKEIYEALFNEGDNPIGEEIRIKGSYYKIIGVIRPVSNIVIGSDVELTAFIPFSVMKTAFQINDKVTYIACIAKPGYNAVEVEEEIIGLLKEAHNISPSDEQAIFCFNIEKEFLIFKYLFDGADILVWIVGIGSLLSGVIGVSNIMLVTIKERTREIGIRRALGASPFTIVRQIISESFILTAVSGIAGLVTGIILLEMVQIEMSKHSFEDVLFIPPFIVFNVAVAALGVLCLAGLLSGLLPSIRALNIKAIEAIREE